MKILGIDPGYDRLGVAVIVKEGSKYNYVFSDCIRTDKDLKFSKRLLQIFKSLKQIIEEHKPEAVAIEDLFMTTNQKTAIKVAEARGVCMALCEFLNVEVYEYTPLQIKNALTGYGKATKDQIHYMVHKIIKIPEMTVAEKKAKKKILDDEVDAIAIALSHGAYARMQIK
jgi:crossover junction endodeoxyribonuclease RuvC